MKEDSQAIQHVDHILCGHVACGALGIGAAAQPRHCRQQNRAAGSTPFSAECRQGGAGVCRSWGAACSPDLWHGPYGSHHSAPLA